MKKLLGCLLGIVIYAGLLNLAFISPASAETDYGEEMSASVVAVDVYSFNLRLKVPQVFDNTKSMGYRKYQSQAIRGDMYIKWLSNGTFEIQFSNLVNNKFKVNRTYVTYKGYEDRNIVYTRYNYIGSNSTESFKTPCICFYLELEPSYAKGGNNEDNSFYVLLSGSGSSTFKKSAGSRIAKKFYGYATGTQGCGCAAYTHKSPTRSATVCGPMDDVSDVVATYGTWTALWKKRIYCSGIICK